MEEAPEGVRLASSWSPLPTELLDHAIHLLEPEEQARTALALLRALPATKISLAALFRHLRQSRDDQVKALTARLARDPDDKCLRSSVCSYRLTCWRPDPFLAAKPVFFLVSRSRLLISFPMARGAQSGGLVQARARGAPQHRPALGARRHRGRAHPTSVSDRIAELALQPMSVQTSLCSHGLTGRV